MRTLSLADPAFLGGQTPASLPILDQLGIPAAVAYSLRKLRSDYAGAAVRVRNDFQLEADIPFSPIVDMYGYQLISITSLLSHCGAGNGFVPRKYDQSGNGRDVTQTDPTRQPQIVSNGVINMINGRPALFFDGNDSMQRTNIGTVFSTPAGFEFQTVVDLVSRAANGFTSLPVTVMNSPAARVVDGYLRSDLPPAEFSYLPGNSGIVNAWPTFTAYDVSPVNAPPAIVGYNATSSTAALFQNGVPTAVSATPGTFAQSNIALTIGRRTDAFTSFPGNMLEIVGFGGTLSTTDRQLLTRDQGLCYGTAVA